MGAKINSSTALIASRILLSTAVLTLSVTEVATSLNGDIKFASTLFETLPAASLISNTQIDVMEHTVQSFERSDP